MHPRASCVAVLNTASRCAVSAKAADAQKEFTQFETKWAQAVRHNDTEEPSFLALWLYVRESA